MNISPTEKLSLDNYHNKANDYSYGSRRTVYKFFPNLSGIKGSKKKIDKVLSQSDIHSLMFTSKPISNFILIMRLFRFIGCHS